jgi:hypothetical protein
LGRKTLPVQVDGICNALKVSSDNYQRAAEIITEEMGIQVTGMFVLKRVKRADLEL